MATVNTTPADLGAVTGYAIAVEKGYNGSLDDWVQLQLNGAAAYTQMTTDVNNALENKIVVGTTTPSSTDSKVWIDTSGTGTAQIPEINDNQVSDVDTWSSQKINSELSQLSEETSNAQDIIGEGIYSKNAVTIGSATAGKQFGALQNVGETATERNASSWSYFGFAVTPGLMYEFNVRYDLGEDTSRNLAVFVDENEKVLWRYNKVGGGTGNLTFAGMPPVGAVKAYVNVAYAAANTAQANTYIYTREYTDTLTEAVTELQGETESKVDKAGLNQITNDNIQCLVKNATSPNIVIDDDIVAGGYYTASGFQVYATWGYYPIDGVKEGDVYRIRYKPNTKGYLGVFVNADNTYTKYDSVVSYHDEDTNFRYYDLTIPTGKKGIIINMADISTSAAEWLVVTVNEDFPAEYIPRIPETWSFDDSIYLPDATGYELPDNWKSRIQEIQTAQGKNFIFAVQTDTHVDFDNENTNYSDPGIGYNLNALSSYIGFDFVANLGDLIHGYANDTTADMRIDMTDLVHRYIYNCSCPVLLTIGNHDDNSPNGGVLISNDELYARVIKPMRNATPQCVFNGQSMYYYIDFDAVRVIVLNSQDGANAHTFAFGQDQITWLDTALNTDKAVLVMCHSPMISEIGTNVPTNSAAVLAKLQTFKTNHTLIGCFYGHEHAQASATVDGILHVAFHWLGTRAEVCIVDLANRTITTKVVGSVGSMVDRSFTF